MIRAQEGHIYRLSVEVGFVYDELLSETRIKLTSAERQSAYLHKESQCWMGAQLRAFS